jgi:hypothetical protein
MTNSIEQFDAHLTQITLFLEYVFYVQKIVPLLATRIPQERLPEIQSEIQEGIFLARRIYNLPDLGNSPPNPLPVDPHCPDHLLSDHMRERIGRNNPLFDIVNAPFTHPIGTQLAMICIDHAWNGYDTFVKSVISEIKERCAHDDRIQRLLGEERQLKNLPTDRTLELLTIGPTTAELVQGVRNLGSRLHVKPEYAELTFRAAKKLRTAFAHRFGRPDKWLLDVVNQNPFTEFNVRLLNSELEVTTAFSRNVIEVISVRAHLINAKTRKAYEHVWSSSGPS